MKELEALNDVFDYITGEVKGKYTTVEIIDKVIDVKLALYRLEKLETKPIQLKHRDFSCPMANTCSSLGWISEECSVKCYLETANVGEKT